MASKYDAYERALRSQRPPAKRALPSGARVGGEVVASEREIKVAGSLAVPGDLKAELVSVAGSLSCSGSLEADTVKVAGSASVGGDLRTSILKVAGSAKVKGLVSARRVKVAGNLTAGRGVEGEEVKVAGCASTPSVRANWLKVSGRLSAKLVEAIDVEIELNAHSTIEEIRARRVHVYREERPKLRFFPLKLLPLRIVASKGSLHARRIIAKELDLEHVDCEEVVGFRVRLRRGCKVKRVVYRDAYYADKGVEVESVTRDPNLVINL